jgi:hypothetical protein
VAEHAECHIIRAAVLVEPIDNIREILSKFGAPAGEGHLHHWAQISGEAIEFLDSELFLDAGVQLAPVKAVIAGRITSRRYEHEQINRHLRPRSHQPRDFPGGPKVLRHDEPLW